MKMKRWTDIMLVKKRWKKVKEYGVIIAEYEGWFLFGIIPLYIKVEKRW